MLIENVFLKTIPDMKNSNVDKYELLHTFEDIADLYSDCDKMKFISTLLTKNKINYDYDLLMIKCGKIWLGLDSYKNMLLSDKPLSDEFKIENPEFKINSFRFIAFSSHEKTIRYSIWNDIESENICVSKIIIQDKKPTRDEYVVSESQFKKLIASIAKEMKSKK